MKADNTVKKKTEWTEDRQTYYNYRCEWRTLLKLLQTAAKIAPEEQKSYIHIILTTQLNEFPQVSKQCDMN